MCVFGECGKSCALYLVCAQMGKAWEPYRTKDNDRQLERDIVLGPSCWEGQGDLWLLFTSPCLVEGTHFFLHYLWVGAQWESVGDFWGEKGRESMLWVTERRDNLRCELGEYRAGGWGCPWSVSGPDGLHRVGERTRKRGERGVWKERGMQKTLVGV